MQDCETKKGVEQRTTTDILVDLCVDLFAYPFIGCKMMKMYVDRLPEHRLASDNKCSDECGGSDWSKYSSVLPLDRLIPIEDEQQSIRHARVQHASPLYIQQVMDERWVVCNPTGTGHIFVLDMEALAFFEQFRTPHTLAEVLGSSEPSLTLIQVLGLLLQGNVLVDDTKPRELCRENPLQTLTAWLHVTNKCNLRCTYCYIEKSQESMSETDAYRSVDAVFRSALKHHIQHLKLKYAGGEASLSIDHVLAIHDYAQQLSEKHDIALSACILSNGVFLSQQALLALKERTIGIMLSLDGIGAYHDSQRTFKNGLGSFKYVDRTIEKLLQHELLPSISVTVSQRNIAGLPALTDYLLDRDLPFFFNYYRENACSAQMEDLQFTEEQMIQGMLKVFHVIEQRLPRRRLLESLLDKADLAYPHQYACGVGRNYLVINQHGDISKCHADIKQQVTTIDADDPLQSLREDLQGITAVSVDEKEGCRECLWRYWCAGGCPMLTYQVTGRNDVRSPNCHIYQALFPEVVRLEALRLVTYETPYSFEERNEKSEHTASIM